MSRCNIFLFCPMPMPLPESTTVIARGVKWGSTFTSSIRVLRWREASSKWRGVLSRHSSTVVGLCLVGCGWLAGWRCRRILLPASMGQHSGWQPQPFDWRSVALFYAFVVLLLGASICPRRARRFCSRPSPVCCCTRRGSGGKRQWLPYWLHVSLGETVLACGLFTVMGLAFTIAWFNMVDNEDGTPCCGGCQCAKNCAT